jgi:hypothetical protein
MFDEKAMDGMDIDSLGASPDGLGASTTPGAITVSLPTQAPVAAMPGYGMPPPAGMQYPVPAMPGYGQRLPRGNPVAGKFDWLEPSSTSQGSAVQSAGLSALFLASAFGVGIALGGPWGAAAGVLLSGCAMNAYRAQKWWSSPDASERFEAVSSTVFGVGGLIIGGYATYMAYKNKKGGTQ